MITENPWVVLVFSGGSFEDDKRWGTD